MTITNPATARLRHKAAPVHAADIDINGAIVRFVARNGSASLNQVMEVFLKAPADGCNLDDSRELIHRLTFLVATGRLMCTKGNRPRYHCTDPVELAHAQHPSSSSH